MGNVGKVRLLLDGRAPFSVPVLLRFHFATCTPGAEAPTNATITGAVPLMKALWQTHPRTSTERVPSLYVTPLPHHHIWGGIRGGRAFRHAGSHDIRIYVAERFKHTDEPYFAYILNRLRAFATWDGCVTRMLPSIGRMFCLTTNRCDRRGRYRASSVPGESWRTSPLSYCIRFCDNLPRPRSGGFSRPVTGWWAPRSARLAENGSQS